MAQRLLAMATVAALCFGCGRSELPPIAGESPRVVTPPGNPRNLRLVPIQNLSPQRRAMLVALEAARVRWRTATPGAYRLVVSQRCFCRPPTPVESEIRNGILESTAGGEWGSGRPVEPSLRTVDMLFAEADRVIHSDADEVSVEFDSRMGYPRRIEIDPWKNSADDEWTWFAELTVLGPRGM